eukprot:SAG31_NODE_740_length_12438_cov_10.788719_4_plen_70_part_00
MSTIDVVYSLNPYDGDSAADKLAALKEEQNKKVTAIILPVIARWSQQVRAVTFSFVPTVREIRDFYREM